MSIIFPSLMFTESKTQLIKGYYIHYHLLTTLKHVSVHNSRGKIPPYSLPICNSYCSEKLNLFPAITHWMLQLKQRCPQLPILHFKEGQRALVQFSKHNCANTDLYNSY